MKLHLPFLLNILLCASLTHTGSTAHPKRGLVAINSPHSSADLNQWTRPASSLTWYYNYSPYPIQSYTHLNFVPMLYSIPSADDTSFTSQVTSLLDANSSAITHLLAFNEPDGPRDQGGTALRPADAATAYLHILLPLRQTYPGLNLGWPAVTGSPRGLTWLAEFNKSCFALAPKTGCRADFLPLHWYGDFGGLAAYIGQLRALYPALPLWATEFAVPDVSVGESEAFLNQSLAYLDGLVYVQRYSYFGAFRSEDADAFVGGNVAMLDDNGGLTELGVTYLGLGANEVGTVVGAAPRGVGIGVGRWAWIMFGVWMVVWVGWP